MNQIPMCKTFIFEVKLMVGKCVRFRSRFYADVSQSENINRVCFFQSQYLFEQNPY